MIALLSHEWRQARADSGGLATSLLFMLAVVAIAAFAIGADLPRLAAAGPAILWIAVLLAALLGNERLFAPDLEDGTLDTLRVAGHGLATYAIAKIGVKWALGVLPLVLLSPIGGALLAMSGEAILGSALTLAVGSFALAALSSFGAALSAGTRGGTVLGPIVAMPLLVPVVIFGASAAPLWAGPGFASPFLFLAACSVLAVAFAPLAIAGLLAARS